MLFPFITLFLERHGIRDLSSKLRWQLKVFFYKIEFYQVVYVVNVV